MSGIDIPVPECQLTIHQPTLKEIAYLGEKNFFSAAQTFCVNKKMLPEGQTLLSDTDNFQIFMGLMKEDLNRKDLILQFSQILFPKYKVIIMPRSIVFNSEQETVTIDENNFEPLQEVLKQILCLNSNKESFNPNSSRAEEIAKKILRGRERIAAEKGEQDSSILTSYISTLTIGLNSMSLDQCLKLTLFQLFDLVERYMLYTNWDLDIRARIAGAKMDSSPDNWMKNIH